MLIRRLIARYIDNILILVASIIIAVIANPIGKSTGNKDLVTITLILSFIIFYTIDYVILTKRSGQSIGKKILRLKLINQNKKDLSYLKVFFRELFLQVLSVTG
ncbi:MAG: RDD family protein, partial [Candidatus Dojkabacteria bacterium]